MKKLMLVVAIIIFSGNVDARGPGRSMAEIEHEMAVIDGRAPVGSAYNGYINNYYVNPTSRIDHRIRPHIDRGGNYHDRFGSYSDGYINGTPTSCYTDRFTGTFSCTSR